MVKYDLHTHTTYCDGKNTAEEMIKSAMKKGFDVIGFSSHAHTPLDESYAMTKEGFSEYKREITALKEKYAGKIKVFLGVEQDLFSDTSIEGLDYVIGSVHYVLKKGEVIAVDESDEILKDASKRLYGGDMLSLCEDYFANVKKLANTECDIIGHFDIITKFNDVGLFDEKDERYVSAWKDAMDALLSAGKLIEINVGAIQRGYRKTPYPSADILSYVFKKGGKVIFSGDSHSAQALGYAMDIAENETKKAGFISLFNELPISIK